MTGHGGWNGAACAVALVLLLGGCSSSEPDALSCADFLDADPEQRRTLVSSAWRADRGGADPPTLSDVNRVCSDAPSLHLGPALRSAAAASAARSATSTTVVDDTGDDVLNVRGVRQIIPIVPAGSGGPSGALPDIAAVCVAESVGPHAVASAFRDPVVVADDDVCYRLGPVLFETTSIGSVVAEGDENVPARRVTIELTGEDAERFAQLTGEVAAATADAPTEQLAFLLNGTLLQVATVHEPVLDGTITLQAGGRTFDPAIVTIFETMTASGR